MPFGPASMGRVHVFYSPNKDAVCFKQGETYVARLILDE